MEIQFNSELTHQKAAIESVVSLLNGQPRTEPEMELSLGAGLAAVANHCELLPEDIRRNLREVQEANGIGPDAELKLIAGEIETADGKREASFPNFSIEMETGTGKTYVYIRTVLELYQRYGMRKFIVVVPSLAVREGVLKSLQITARHLKELYGNPTYRYYTYDSSSLSQVRGFASSSGVEIMVMTLDSFNKAVQEDGKGGNVIFKATDKLSGERPIHLIQNTRPILILDEPQNMESEKSVAALAILNPLFALRYSATHRNPYNVVYRLTPYDAYRQRLVKRIEVAAVLKADDANQAFLRLEAVQSQKNAISAKVVAHKLSKEGAVKESAFTVRLGSDLEQLTSMPLYQGYVVDEIDVGAQRVLFSNGVELSTGDARGADKDAVFEGQIRYTVEEHMRKANRFRDAGIKVLSLFFIDRVDSYALEEGIIKRLFDKAYLELSQKYPEWQQWKPEEVRAAYFAQRKVKGDKGAVEAFDTTGKSAADAEAYDLIMKDKERLLSFETPVAFIFSHSALREGWDNPNVFQICTLNQSTSEIKKRQEVGRGVRLAVNQTGERVHSEFVNVLTVVANESYERYVEKLQAEVEEEYGAGTAPPVRRAEAAPIRLRKEWLLKDEFKELWDKIKHKTRYAVRLDSDELVTAVLKELDSITIGKPRIEITKAKVDVGSEDAFQAMQMSRAKTLVDLSGRYPLPNLIDLLLHQLEHTSPPVRLTRKTLARIVRETASKADAVLNPQEFVRVTADILKEKLADLLVNGIEYIKISELFEQTLLDDEEYSKDLFVDFKSWARYIEPAEDNCLYDHSACESETESRFAKELNDREDVKLYIKLPNWFTVDTPIGTYNPDWAVVFTAENDGEPVLCLVAETKGTTDRSQLRQDERRKITCGEKHFADTLGVTYKLVSKSSQLP